ncbi:UNVERIFIED_ORG: transposase-like protein [Paraburkholderia sediminicola]|nr:transposase-like protein [Paraburkholderia sediminicola]
MKVEGLLPEDIALRSSRHPKNQIDRNHRDLKSRVDVMLGFKRFRYSTVAISGIELMDYIRRGQLGLTDVRLTGTTAPVVWIAKLSVC